MYQVHTNPPSTCVTMTPSYGANSPTQAPRPPMNMPFNEDAGQSVYEDPGPPDQSPIPTQGCPIPSGIPSAQNHSPGPIHTTAPTQSKHTTIRNRDLITRLAKRELFARNARDLRREPRLTGLVNEALIRINRMTWLWMYFRRASDVDLFNVFIWLFCEAMTRHGQIMDYKST